ncbi:MAG: hypothetical protein KAS30_02210, partial [Candidatus Diapherotrites archaeon]|nr:hypothetical protein [Candidatus Diapherotrites archaeon]
AFLDSIKSFFSGDDTGTQTSTPAVAPALEQDNIQSVIDTATAPKEDVVFGLPKFEPKPQPNQTPVPADNLDKDAVDVSEVESAIRDSVAPETGAGFGTAERTTALADEPVEDVPTTPEAPSIRDQIQEGILSALGQDTTAEKARLREEAGIEEKANTSNRILNQLRTMRVDFESKKDDLENTNEAGRSMGSINNEINKLTKDTNRNLAYKSIEFDIANNDLQSAEATVNNRIQDMKDEQTKQVNLYKTLFDFVQDDMSESEQLQANQAFAEKQAQQSFENQKELADYSSLLRKDEAMFTQNLKNAVTAQEAEQASKALVPSLQEKVGQIDEAIADLASGSANVVGANVLARFSLLKPFGAGANFIANIEK